MVATKRTRREGMKGSFKVALIAAAVSGVVSASAAVATTQTFVLGTTDRVNAATKVTNLQANGTTVNPVDAPLMTLENKSSSANATPLLLTAASGHAPLKVNTQTKVANLNADQLDGKDSSSFTAGTGDNSWGGANINAGATALFALAPSPRAYKLSYECPQNPSQLDGGWRLENASSAGVSFDVLATIPTRSIAHVTLIPNEAITYANPDFDHTSTFQLFWAGKKITTIFATTWPTVGPATCHVQ